LSPNLLSVFFLQILIRISYDISLGLLHGINQDIYSCSLPWLQALDACCKSSFLGFFLLPQFLCVLLLPQGVQSLEDITAIGRAVKESREGDSSSNPHVETTDDDIFSFFDAFYSIMSLYRIWWRDSAVLSRFVVHTYENEAVSKPNTPDNESSLVNEGSRSTNVTGLSKKDIESYDNGNLESTNAVGEEGQDGSVTARELYEKSDTLTDIKDISKEPLSSCTSREVTFGESKDQLDLSSVITRMRDVLLPEDRILSSALKKQLLEVKKEVILLRSRRILDSVAVGKNPSAKQKRKSKKKEKTNPALKESAQGLGSTTTGTTEDDLLGSKRENGNEGDDVKDGDIEDFKQSALDEGKKCRTVYVYECHVKERHSNFCGWLNSIST
jgi:hypothetical protein